MEPGPLNTYPEPHRGGILVEPRAPSTISQLRQERHVGGTRVTISLLTELARDFCGTVYKDAAPNGAAAASSSQRVPMTAEAPPAARGAWRSWGIRGVSDVGGARGTRAAGAGRAKLVRVVGDAKRELVDEGDAGFAARVRGREALLWSKVRISGAPPRMHDMKQTGDRRVH